MAHDSESLRQAFHYFYGNELPLLKSLPDLVHHSPCVVVNIGAGAGTSGLAFLESRQDLILHTVDIQDADSPFGCLYAERQVCQAAGYALGERWFQYHVDSKRLAAYWTELADIVFVDGGHEYDEAMGDILSWLPHIRDGGYMAVHDYRKGDIPTGPDGFNADGPHPLVWTGVDRAVDNHLKSRYDVMARMESLIVFKIEE